MDIYIYIYIQYMFIHTYAGLVLMATLQRRLVVCLKVWTYDGQLN